MPQLITSLELEPCCHKTIEYINRVISGTKFAAAALGTGLVFQMLFSPPGHPKSIGLVSTVVNIGLADWQLFAQAIAGLKETSKRQISSIADLHALDHVRDNKRNCYLFWRGIHESFL